MAITQTVSLDIVGQTSTISFYVSASLVDQISFGSNQITFTAISTFNLSKSDLLLYIQYKIAWLNSLFLNFPEINQFVGQAFPVSNFQISNTFAGVTHITYNETSSGVTAVNINYVPTASSGAFTARASPVTITMQEFFMNIYMLQQYQVQVQDN
jgi:hypothetical protein